MMEWIASTVKEHGLASQPVLEIGSLIVNGSPRPCFDGEYVGVDMRDGPGVDRVANAEHLPWGCDVWPVVVCAEMLEHALRPFKVVEEMARVCRPGGFILASARGFDEWGCWRYHGFPDDHFRYSRDAFRVLCADAGLDVVELVADPVGPGWLLAARKPLRDVYRAAS